MKMYDFSMLASREAGKNGTASASDAQSVNRKMDEAAAMFSRELFDGFYDNGIHLIRLGSKSLRLQRFVTSGIYSLLFIFGDADKNISVTFSLSVLKEEKSFRVMCLYNYAKRTMPYPFDSDTPSASDVAFVANVANTLCADIEALMDSAFEGRP